jgi:hypothetical protein
MKSLFFWSEEEARAHRAANSKPRGLYVLLRLGAIVIKPIQSLLFGFAG